MTLVVSAGHRSGGVGRALLAAAEDIARARGLDTVKIAVMSGNARAQDFYEANGYTVAEHMLYRRLYDRSRVGRSGQAGAATWGAAGSRLIRLREN